MGNCWREGWCLRAGTDEPKEGRVREWGNMDLPGRDCFGLMSPGRQMAPLELDVMIVSGVARKSELK